MRKLILLPTLTLLYFSHGVRGLRMMASSASTPRVFLITGATDGIGKHTAKKLATDGHRLLVHGRKDSDSDVVRELVADLRERGAADVLYLRAELQDLEEVTALAEQAAAATDHLDVLINNAGVFDPPQDRSAQGLDVTWAVNVVAPFRLTRHLLPLLAKGNEMNSDARVVTTSSISQSSSLPVDLSEVGVANGAFSSAHSAYSLSKLGDYLFTVGLAARLAEASSEASLRAVRCLTMDPGTVNTKMLLAGWGACGIPVSSADNTYRLAATDEGAGLESGSYSFGGPGSRDAKDKAKVDALWALLEEQAGCSYEDL